MKRFPLKRETIGTRHAIGLVLFACFQNALIGGVIFGWAGMETLLHAPVNEGGAGLSPLQTSQLFSYGSSAAMMAPLVVGPILDAKGPRFALVASHLTVLLGFAGFAVASSSCMWQFTISVIFMAFGGPGVQLAVIHLANLFPNNKFLAVSFLTGSITISFSMLAVLEEIWELSSGQIGYKSLFGGYCIIIVASMMGNLFFSPTEPLEEAKAESAEQIADDMVDTINDAPTDSDLNDKHQQIMQEKEQEEIPVNQHRSLEQDYVDATLDVYAHHHKNKLLLTDYNFDEQLRHLEEQDPTGTTGINDTNRSSCSIRTTNSFHESKQALLHVKDNDNKHVIISLKDQTFVYQLKSATFARAVIIFVSLSFLVNFTIASLNVELADIDTFSDIQRHSLSQQFSFLLTLGMPFAVLVGFLMDRFGLEAVTFLSLAVGIISTFLILTATFLLPELLLSHDNNFWSYPAMIVGFAVYSLFRQFVFVVFLSWISAKLGVKYFGILSGIGFAISGFSQLFMSDLVRFIHDDFYPTTTTYSGDSTTSRTNFRWMIFHIVQICFLASLIWIPIANFRDQKRLQDKQELLQKQEAARPLIATTTTSTSTTTTCNKSYGAVE